MRVSAVAVPAVIASKESERSRLRRIPDSTSAMRRTARSIQSNETAFRQAAKFRQNVDIAYHFRLSSLQQHHVFQQQVQAAQQILGLLLALGPGAIGFRHAEQRRMVRFSRRRPQQQQGILAAGKIGIGVERDRPANRPFRQSRHQGASSGGPLRVLLGQDLFLASPWAPHANASGCIGSESSAADPRDFPPAAADVHIPAAPPALSAANWRPRS